MGECVCVHEHLGSSCLWSLQEQGPLCLAEGNGNAAVLAILRRRNSLTDSSSSIWEPCLWVADGCHFVQQ